jgi:hypothetical protein
MKTNPDFQKDIATIRNIMERSSKFLSLSGLAGIMAGIYALVGAAIAYPILHGKTPLLGYQSYDTLDADVRGKIVMLALAVLALALVTALWLSSRKARRRAERMWTALSRRILLNFAIPLVTGGLFVIIVIFTGHFSFAAPACLIFYGLALISISANTYDEVRYLGFCEIGLGLAALALPGYGLLLWAIGFGVLHVIYGVVMYNKYDK